MKIDVLFSKVQFFKCSCFYSHQHFQPFQKAKPCINCNENVTRVKSQFWEGGKGCRDQVVMSRYRLSFGQIKH